MKKTFDTWGDEMKFQRIFSEFVEDISGCNTPIQRRIYANVYNKDLLCGIFADGNGNGYIEGEEFLPKYAVQYIKKFIRGWKRKN